MPTAADPSITAATAPLGSVVHAALQFSHHGRISQGDLPGLDQSHLAVQVHGRRLVP